MTRYRKLEIAQRVVMIIACLVVIIVSVDALRNESLTISHGLQNDSLAYIIVFQVIFYACILIGIIGIVGAFTVKWDDGNPKPFKDDET